MTELRVPGAIVLVDVPGQGTWLHTMGVGDLATNTPMAAENHMRIGSVTKTMTATVILQLVDEGKLALDDPVAKYEPLVPNGANITVRQLLNMTSGLFNDTEDDAFNHALDAQPEKAWTDQEMWAIAFAHPPYFAPGDGWHYSNTNYSLLGDIAERTGGGPLAQLMQERIFGPLAMNDTLLPQRDTVAIPEPHQRGYMYGTNVINNDIYNAALAGNKAAAQLDAGPDVKPPDVTDWSPSSTYADGAAISTAHDLQIYAKALATGELLSPAGQHERTQFVPAGSYGLGLEKAAGGLLGHNGAIPGFQSFVGYQPDTGVTVVVLANLLLGPHTYLGDALPADEMAKVIQQQLLPS